MECMMTREDIKGSRQERIRTYGTLFLRRNNTVSVTKGNDYALVGQCKSVSFFSFTITCSVVVSSVQKQKKVYLTYLFLISWMSDLIVLALSVAS